MKKENISYENNPTEYESNLKQKLSSDNHTKETLVNVAVHTQLLRLKKKRDCSSRLKIGLPDCRRS